MSNLSKILGPIRLPFLILAPCCVLLGLGSAVYIQGSVSVLYAVLAFVGGLASHISVNAFNEYFDFKSGLDFRTIRTPFSGGSGTLPANPEMARIALITGIISSIITALIGIYFIMVWGYAILLLGLLGLVTIITYTTLMNYNWFLCLIAPGLGFGTFMVLGTDFVLTGSYSWVAFIASLVPFFLVNNLLLLNQFPDVDADKTIGRKNIPILFGRKIGAVVFVCFLGATYLSIILGVVFGYLPLFTLLGLGSIIIGIPLARGVLQNSDNIEKLIPFMGMNVIVNLLTPVLMAIGFFLSNL